MKFLFWLAVLALVGWLWQQRGRRGSAGRVRHEPPVRRMVACARCGVHLPEDEAVSLGGKSYCSPAHRDEDAGRP